jgi:hypothetical protein
MKEFLTGPNGEQSSKRLFTLALMIVYVMVIIVNLFTGKKLDATLQEQLFYMILTFYGLIALEGWKTFRSVKPNGPATDGK